MFCFLHYSNMDFVPRFMFQHLKSVLTPHASCFILFVCVCLFQELGKKLFKRRRVLGREKRKKHQIVGFVVDEDITTIHHLKKRKSVISTN